MSDRTMTKSELINRLYLKGDLSQEDVSAITNTIIDTMQDPVELPAKYVAHFKPGKDLRERVNSRFNHEQ